MIFDKRLAWAGHIAIFGIWIALLTQLGTLDLDESLYRRVAEEMKLTGKWFEPTWDQRPLYHKPPFFYWMIAWASSFVDGLQVGVSSLAARVPGFIAALGITWALGFSRSTWLWMMTFPLITACAVIYDPWQTLLLLPAILIPNRWFQQERAPSKIEIAWVATSLTAAATWKGLNGLVLPGLAMVLHLLLTPMRRSFEFWKKLIALGFIASAATAVCYGWLDQKLGRAFTNEFIGVHHLGRSQAPMESHGGSPLYYLWVLILGLGLALPYFLERTPSMIQHWKTRGFALTWVLTFILFFSFTATKLPHYLWPAWPAIALLISDHERTPMKRPLLLLAFFPILLLSALSLLIALDLRLLLLVLPEGTPAHSVLSGPVEVSVLMRFGFLGSAIVFAWIAVKRTRMLEKPREALIAFAFAMLMFSLGTISLVQQLIASPVKNIAQAVLSMELPPDTCVRYSGPHSPSLSLELGNQIFHNRCEPDQMKLLIAPSWKAEECAERGFEIIKTSGYLVLCQRPGPKTPVDALKKATAAEALIAPDLKEELLITQISGIRKSSETLDQMVVGRFAGPDQKLGTADDVPAVPVRSTQPVASAAPDGEPLPKTKVKHLGTQSAPATYRFVGQDQIEVRYAGKDKKPMTSDDQVYLQKIGPDLIPNSEDDVLVVQYSGNDKTPGTADDIQKFYRPGPDLVFGSSDDVLVDTENKPVTAVAASATSPAADASDPAPAPAVSFPKPATRPTARKTVTKVSTPSVKASNEKVTAATFDRNQKVVQIQVVEMDFCEAYLCEDEFRSERVIENIEYLIDEFPNQNFRQTQLRLLEQSLAKATEYKKNWKKYTPDFEVGLMSQQQVDDAMNPLISKIRKLIDRIKKEKARA